MLKNKKGLSVVISTLIIILLVLVAIGIIWVVVQGIVEEGGAQVEAKARCIGVDLKIKSVGTCIAGSISCDVTIERGTGGGDIDGVRVVVTDGATSLTGDGAVLDVFDTVTISATGSSALGSAATTAKVAALITDDAGEEVVCDIVTEYTY